MAPIRGRLKETLLMIRFVKTLGLLIAASAPLMVASTTTLGLSACSSAAGGGTGGGSNKDGGGGGGGGTEAFEVFDLDNEARETLFFAMGVDPGTTRVGVAYFTPSRAVTTVAGGDGGTEHNFDLMYVEWQDGVISTPQKLRSMQRMIGLSLAFDPLTHEPVVAFLGGDPGFVVGKSIYWYQNDASLMRRSGAAWAETGVATESSPPSCSPIDIGFLEGLWSNVVFDPSGKMYVAFRDGHNGQFPQQDWAASDVEVLEGANEASLSRRCLTGDHKQAYGGRIDMAIGPNNQPVLVYDQAFGGADTTGQNVLFQMRQSDGSWSVGVTLLSISNTMSGASIAYDTTEGIGIAVTDRVTSQLKYIKSATGASWTVPDDVFGSGTGGWYPSLSMDPVYHEPAVAFYVCSARSGIADTNCLQSEDELRVTQRVGSPGTWRETVVDVNGGWAPKLEFFASGKRVVAYRTPAALDSTVKVNPKAGALRLAVER